MADARTALAILEMENAHKRCMAEAPHVVNAADLVKLVVPLIGFVAASLTFAYRVAERLDALETRRAKP